MYESELFRYIFGVIDSGNQTIINPDMVDGRHSFAGIAHHQNGRRQDNIGVTDFKTVYRDISSGIVLADIQQACFATATSSGHDWLFDIHILNNKIVDFRNAKDGDFTIINTGSTVYTQEYGDPRWITVSEY